MESIHANYFSIGTIGNTVHLRVALITPTFDAQGNRMGNEKAKEFLIVMNPEEFEGLKKVVSTIVATPVEEVPADKE